MYLNVIIHTELHTSVEYPIFLPLRPLLKFKFKVYIDVCTKIMFAFLLVFQYVNNLTILKYEILKDVFLPKCI